MKTWGVGVFENVAALDAMHDLGGEIASEIAGTFDVEFGIEDIDGLLAMVAALTALVEHCHAACPEPPVVASWGDRTLRVFDAEVDDLEPAEGYKDGRRRVIVDTFGHLLAAAAARHDEAESEIETDAPEAEA